VHAVIPAMASEAPISFRNPRRETASSHSDAPLGNSRCIISLNSGLPASSSRLRQNSGPFVWAMRARAVSRSSLSFFPGQTSSARDLLLESVIFNFVQGVRLSVTRRAAGNVLFGSQVVLFDQVVAQRELIHIFRAVQDHRLQGSWLFVTHIEHLLARAEILS